MQSDRTSASTARNIIIYTWTILATLFLATLVILSSFFTRTGNFNHLIARFWGRSILWVSGVRVFVKGKSNLLADGSAIYMANHQSNYDIPVLLAALPVQFRWLAKAELFRIPFFGHGMRGCGYISIDRSDRQSAFRSLARAAETIRKGTSVLIFPEGTRSHDGRINSFKKGGFVLTVEAGVPIVPIIIEGTRSIMPKGRKRITPRDVTMEILPSVDTSVYDRSTKDELIDRVRSIMCDRYNQIRGDNSCA